MKQYFYSEDNQQFGPFTIEELKSKKIKKSALIWTDSMDNWSIAESVEELKEILISEPPPLPKIEANLNTTPTQHKSLPSIVVNSKYDLNYKREVGATLLGVGMLVGLVILRLSDVFKFKTEEIYNQGVIIIVVISFILRITIMYGVVGIAKEQNRNTVNWGFFSFFFPLLALIIIGLLRRHLVSRPTAEI